MGYEGKGLGKHTRVIVEPIIVEKRCRYLGLVYGKHDGEFSKAKEAHEGVPRRTLHVHYLKLVKFVFMRNAKILHPFCKKVLISMQLMKMQTRGC